MLCILAPASTNSHPKRRRDAAQAARSFILTLDSNLSMCPMAVADLSTTLTDGAHKPDPGLLIATVQCAVCLLHFPTMAVLGVLYSRSFCCLASCSWYSLSAFNCRLTYKSVVYVCYSKELVRLQICLPHSQAIVWLMSPHRMTLFDIW